MCHYSVFQEKHEDSAQEAYAKGVGQYIFFALKGGKKGARKGGGRGIGGVKGRGRT